MKENKGLYKAVFTDIDGTFEFRDKEILGYNLSVVQKVRSLGVKVFINTGRSCAMLPKELDAKMNFDGAVMGNGSHIILGGKTIFEAYLDNDFLKKSYEFFEKESEWIAYEGDEKILFRNAGYNENALELTNFAEFEKMIEKYRINKLSYGGGKAIGDKISLLYPDKDIIQQEYYGELMLKNLGKESGIKKLCAMLGIKKEETVAIGDSMNDFKMIGFAGMGIAMGNGIEAVKKHADFVCGKAENGGFGDALKKVFDIK